MDGVPVVDSDLRANVTADGQLINVGGGLRGGLTLNTVAPAVSARAAYAGVLRSAGSIAAAPAVRRQAGSLRTTAFAGGGAAGLVVYTAGAQARLAWRTLVPVSNDEDLDALVDAQTGEVVRRSNLVKRASGLVHDNFPDETAPAPRRAAHGVVRPVAVAGSHDADRQQRPRLRGRGRPGRHEHHVQHRGRHLRGGRPARRRGRPVRRQRVELPDPERRRRGRVLPARVAGLHVEPHDRRTRGGSNAKQATTQLFYFVNRFHDHLAEAPIGFDAASGNFQRVNAAGAGQGGDPVLAQSDDGANTAARAAGRRDHSDNANFDTRPDGTPGRMQMYLFEPIVIDPTPPPFILPFAAANGSDDPSDRLPRVHARALQPADHRRTGLRRPRQRPGRRDGRGMERLVRARLHQRPGLR